MNAMQNAAVLMLLGILLLGCIAPPVPVEHNETVNANDTTAVSPGEVSIKQGTVFRTGNLSIGVIYVHADSAALAILIDSVERTITLKVGEDATVDGYRITNLGVYQDPLPGLAPGSDNSRVTLRINRSLAGLGPITNPPSLAGNMTVRLEIHDSFPKLLVVQNDGMVVFTEGNRTDRVEISPGEVESLRQSVLENDFFSLNESYEGSYCCDFIANTINVTIGNVTHAVYCYNECPAQFDEIERRIKSLWPYEIQYSGFA